MYRGHFVVVKFKCCEVFQSCEVQCVIACLAMYKNTRGS